MKYTFFFILVACSVLPSHAQRKVKKPEIGIVQDYKNDSLLYASGYRYLVESVGKCFSPKKVSDQQFSELLETFKSLKMKIEQVNIFIPGELKLVGPDVKEEAILSYAKVVFERCQAAGVKMVVWGSGGARRLPDGFDRNEATEQFIYIAKKVALIARQYKIDIALENLNQTETNFITSVDEAHAIAVKVDQPNFGLCVDIYHMLKEGEPAAAIEKTKKYLMHIDIAEKENRAPPGVGGEDFRVYLKMLKKVGYSGKIILECRFNDLEAQALPAFVYLQKQIDEVYGI